MANYALYIALSIFKVSYGPEKCASPEFSAQNAFPFDGVP
jgi:hypothetical protein